MIPERVRNERAWRRSTLSGDPTGRRLVAPNALRCNLLERAGVYRRLAMREPQMRRTAVAEARRLLGHLRNG